MFNVYSGQKQVLVVDQMNGLDRHASELDKDLSGHLGSTHQYSF